MTNSEKLEHLLCCAKRGAHAGSSGNEKNARAIVEAIMDGVIGLDADATAGIAELAQVLRNRGFQARDEIRAQIGPNPKDVHYLELRDEQSGLKCYLAGRGLHAGDLVEVFTNHGWEKGRLEWSCDESSPPTVAREDDECIATKPGETPCRPPAVS